jgi:hypothetical protein
VEQGRKTTTDACRSFTGYKNIPLNVKLDFLKDSFGEGLLTGTFILNRISSLNYIIESTAFMIRIIIFPGPGIVTD